jgi:hypothetical protein
MSRIVEMSTLVTREQIEAGLARGRQERSVAFLALIGSALRSVEAIVRGRRLGPVPDEARAVTA